MTLANKPELYLLLMEFLNSFIFIKISLNIDVMLMDSTPHIERQL